MLYVVFNTLATSLVSILALNVFTNLSAKLGNLTKNIPLIHSQMLVEVFKTVGSPAFLFMC